MLESVEADTAYLEPLRTLVSYLDDLHATINKCSGRSDQYALLTHQYRKAEDSLLRVIEATWGKQVRRELQAVTNRFEQSKKAHDADGAMEKEKGYERGRVERDADPCWKMWLLHQLTKHRLAK